MKFFNTNCKVQLQVTWHRYNLVDGSATINQFAIDICTAQLQVTCLTQFSPGSVTRYTTPDFDPGNTFLLDILNVIAETQFLIKYYS